MPVLFPSGCPMFRWFENLLNPYPPDAPSQPPNTLLAFCLHYMDGVKLPLIAMAVLSTLVALAEIALFGFWAMSLTGFQPRTRKRFWPTRARCCSG